jgi:uncharacterized membrane protein
MTPRSRLDAQQRADQIRAFEAELKRLQDDGVLSLTEEQQRAVTTHHATLLAQYAQTFDIDRDVEAKQLSLGMRIASFLGALALAASVFFLFYQFWGLFSTAMQVVVLMTAALGSFLATLWIQSKDATGYFTKLAALVAFACFVLNIAMLGQIFNIAPSDKALVVWAGLALLLAYACDLRLLLAAGILCIIAFISARTGTWSGMYWIYFGQRPENFFPAAVALLVIPQFIDHNRFSGFEQIYRVFGLLTWFLPVLVLSNWGAISYLDLEPKAVEVLYQIVGFAGSAAAVWVGIRRQWPEVVNTSVTMFVILLYTKLFDWWWEAMPKYLFFMVLALIAILFLLVLKRLRTLTLRRGGGGTA